jgi:hypothetical protein
MSKAGNVYLRITICPYEVMGDWRELNNEKLHNLHSLPNIIRMIKSRRMRWVCHVA